MLKLRCPACRKKYQLPEAYLDKRVHCTACSAEFDATRELLVDDDVSFWRTAMNAAAEQYGGYEEPSPEEAQAESAAVEPEIEPAPAERA
jgi:hypothetical protein